MAYRNIKIAQIVLYVFFTRRADWKSYGYAFYDFKGPEKLVNTAQYEKFLFYFYAHCESPNS